MTAPQSAYSPEELEEAKNQIAALTPEAFIDISRYIQSMESLDRQTTLPEAAGVSWRDVFDDAGSRVNLTARAASPELALRALMEATAVANREYGLRTTPFPAADQPQYIPDLLASQPQQVTVSTTGQPAAPKQPAQGLETFPVETVQHAVSQTGVHYVLAKGGPWVTYGWKAYKEKVPSEIKFEDWPIGQLQPVPTSMRVAILDKAAKKIVGFQSA